MSENVEQFEWTSPSGAKITLPAMNRIKSGVIRRHRHEEPGDFMFSVLEEVSDEAMLAKADDLLPTEINDLFEAWQKAGQVTLGESEGSSS